MSWLNRNTSTNILTEARGSEQTPQVLNEIKKHVKENYPQRQPLFEARLSSRALQGFAKNCTIKGIKGYDPQSFLDGARENRTRILKNN